MKGLCVSKGSVRGKAIIVDSVFATKTIAPGVAAHKTGFEKQILWQLPDKGC